MRESRPMRTKQKSYSGAFKAKVGIEAILGIKTVAQIAREYRIHPVQVSQWKATIRERLSEVFEPSQNSAEDQERLIAHLHQKIGQLTVDLDWLIKKSKQWGV